MAVNDVIQFLGNWQQTPQESRITSSALGQQVRSNAQEQAEAYSSSADKFAGLEPVYILRLLEGLQQAAVNEKLIVWSSVLKLIQFTYASTSDAINRGMPASGDDTIWERTCKEASELLLTGLRLGAAGIEAEHRAFVQSLVSDAITLFPDALDGQQFAEKFERNPYFAAHETFQGIATELCVLLVHWQYVCAALGDQKCRQAICDDAKIAKLFEEQLVTSAPKGLIVRAIMGRYLQFLYFYDEGWLRSRMLVLFPRQNDALRQASWSTHLMNDHGPVAELMPELGFCYDEEIAHLAGDRTEKSEDDLRRQRLADYLSVLVLKDAASDELINTFHERAGGDLKRRAMWFMGTQVVRATEGIRDEMCRRVQTYWETRISAAAASCDPTKYNEELDIIDLWCFQDVFDELWLAKQLLRMIAIGLIPSDSLYSVEWLAKLAVQHVDYAVEILFGFIKHADKKRWIYLTNQRAIRIILSEGFRRGSSETAGRARRILSHLASLGDASYLDLDQVPSSQ